MMSINVKMSKGYMVWDYRKSGTRQVWSKKASGKMHNIWQEFAHQPSTVMNPTQQTTAHAQVPLAEKHFTDELTAAERADVLMKLAGQLLDHLHRIEASANQTTLTVAAAMVVVPGYFFGRTPALAFPFRIAVAAFLIFIAIATIWLLERQLAHGLLERQLAHAKWLRRAIVRVQQALGMYRRETYITTALLNDPMHKHWINEPILFPAESQRWGAGAWLENQFPYMMAIACSCVAGVVMLLVR
jgi:hypothetical protein